MDFVGQRLAELWLVRIIVGFAVLGFCSGYGLGDFTVMASCFGVGLLVAFLAVVPDWPIYRKHPLSWLPPLHSGPGSGPLVASAGQPAKKPKKSS